MNLTCPFCTSTELVLTTDRQSIVERIMHWVRCLACGAQGPWKTTRSDAIEAWNNNFVRKQAASIGEDHG